MNWEATIRWLCPWCLLAALSGCHSAASVEAPAGETTSVALREPAAAHDSAAQVPELAATEKAKEAPTATTAVAQFTPPFPDRTELFEPPKRATSSVRRDEEQGESVELKGFINVDKPRAVLSIDGVISPVAEGGEKYGVQVISIQPPSVVLQRGRNRWTATLE
jgi:hypothetical protein